MYRLVNRRGASMSQINLGLIGEGNNSCALIQGIHYYGTPEGRAVAKRNGDSIIFDTLCGYPIGAIEVVCAFDVDERKVGQDLHAAIFSDPNCYPRCFELPDEAGVTVSRAPVLDGVPDFLRVAIEIGEVAEGEAEDLFDD